ncbi:MAG: zinc-dependent alcohol dehydrogenase family protein [Gammaproteobacteria bacterium]|nr:zinc-dependent alcohol dehydrogenase family protein [Gammaproteobacteria bacterium]MYF59730.1 zinc-dependent alcohol dehydrogenase family protein [Gammaproteobacteria bacterium]
MRAMILSRPRGDLRSETLDLPSPSAGEVRGRVLACGVCRTDLHLVDGELPDPSLPIVPGHEAVAIAEEVGKDVDRIRPGQRFGVPWLAWTCGECRYCGEGRENLCERAQFTGFHRHGGYAEGILADARYCVPIPESYSDEHAAPLLCAGLIGYRSWKLAGPAQRLGIYGFGAAAHIVAQVAMAQNQDVYAFVRPGDRQGEAFARELGAVWAGPSERAPPRKLDAALIFAPVGSLIPAALSAVRKGGTVVCGGIHMSEIPAFPYDLLWGERVLRSVANLTRADADEFMSLAEATPISTSVRSYPLEEANAALADLRAGRLNGAAVLVP